jgi:predicted acetyltransferase
MMQDCIRESKRMKLVEPSPEYYDSFIRMSEDYKREGSVRYQFEKDITSAVFDEYLQKIESGKYVDAAVGDLVPQISFWMIDESKEIFGVSRFRPKLNQLLMKEGGNVGYDVPPSKRKKGHATQLLALTLDRARESGLNRVLVTCDKDNSASRKVIEKNGGVLESEVISDVTGKEVLRYWIELCEMIFD